MEKKGFLVVTSVIVLGILAFLFDNRLAVFFRSLENPVITPILWVFEPTLFIVLLAVTMIILALVNEKKQYITPTIITLAISTLISYGLKFIIMRPRPFSFVEYLPFLNLIDYSFPSSHCVAIFALLPILNKEFKKLRYLWVCVALIVAFTRLYFGMHYLSDVIFGSLIGYGIGLLIADRINKKIKNK